MSIGRLIIHCGLQAAGKTTAAQRDVEQIPGAVLFDKDTANPYESQMCANIAEGEDDRDSPAYVRNVLPITRDMLFTAVSGYVLRNPDVTAVVDAPLLEDMAYCLNTETSLDGELRYLLNDHDSTLRITTIWHHADEITQRNRMLDRRAPRDAAKLRGWGNYLRSTETFRDPHRIAPYMDRISANVVPDPHI